MAIACILQRSCWTNLIDAYHQKFHDSPRTYMWGTKRLDNILVDPDLTQAIEHKGYLGMHEGAETDHVYANMDLNDKVANQGAVHRPITTKSRDFLLAQSDKVKNFLDELVPSAKHENYKPRVIKLARSFSTHGPTQDNVRVYQQMNNSFSIISPKALPHGI